MIRNKILLVSALTCSILFSADLNYETMKQVGKTAEEARIYEQSSLLDLERKTAEAGQLNYSEVVYEHLKAYQKYNPPKRNATATPIPAGYDFYTITNNVNTQIAQAQQAQAQAQQAAQMQPDIRFTSAYCSVKNEVQIERIAGYAILSCDFDLYGKGELAVTLTPDFYSLALVATPLHATIKGKKYLIREGAVLNATRTSINVATSVNDYKIEKMVAAGAVALGTTATEQARNYLAQYEASQVEQTAGETITTNGTVITPNSTLNVNKPQASTYLAQAGIEFVSQLATMLGNAFLDNIPYSFKINKNTLLFADLSIDFNQNGVRGVGYAPSNLVLTDEPRMTAEGVWGVANNRNFAKEIPLDAKNGVIPPQTQFRAEYNNQQFNMNAIPSAPSLQQQMRIQQMQNQQLQR